MNRLPLPKRAQMIQMLVEGASLRSVSRMADVSINTVTKLLVDMGDACADLHDRTVRRLNIKRLQADEIWSFVGAKQKNASPEQKAIGWGDAWAWVGIDPDTKLVVSYFVGGRDTETATAFAFDLRKRVLGKPQITTDSLQSYLTAIEIAFGDNVDYAAMHKLYGASDDTPEARYSPARCIGCDMKTVIGEPDYRHVSTSYVERQNLTMRLSIRRFTQLTNAFSKKIDNHLAAVALHFAHYSFVRIHKTLRITPAMAAGISDHVWSLEEIAALAQ